MIENKEISIKKTDNLSTVYIESAFEKLGLDVLRWSIVDVKADHYVVNISVVQD